MTDLVRFADLAAESPIPARGILSQTLSDADGLTLALFAFGWALNVPVVTLMVLDLFPTRRGMASSLQAVVASAANGLVAGVIAPVVMHSTVALAATSLAMLCVGLFAWLYLRRY